MIISRSLQLKYFGGKIYLLELGRLFSSRKEHRRGRPRPQHCSQSLVQVSLRIASCNAARHVEIVQYFLYQQV